MSKEFMRWEFASHAPVASAPPGGTSIAPLSEEDLPEIAHLMVEGYRGTIDFEDETDDDALAELRDAIAGSNGEPLREGWLVARAAAGVAVSAMATILYERLGFVGSDEPDDHS